MFSCEETVLMVGVKIAENRFSQVFRFFPYLLAGPYHNSLSRMSHARQESVTRAINPARWTSDEPEKFKLVLPLSHSAHFSHHCLLRVVSVHARSSHPLGMQHWTRWVGWVASEGTRGVGTWKWTSSSNCHQLRLFSNLLFSDTLHLSGM